MMRLGFFIFSTIIMSGMYLLTTFVYNTFFDFTGVIKVFYYGAFYTVIFMLLDIVIRGFADYKEEE